MEKTKNYEKQMKIFENYKKKFQENFQSFVLPSTPDNALYANADINRTFNYPIFFLDDVIAYLAIFQFYTNNYQNSLESLNAL